MIDVVKLAREAEIDPYLFQDELQSFAALIVEECAKKAETHGVYPELNVWAGGPEWYKHGKSIADAIRQLVKK